MANICSNIVEILEYHDKFLAVDFKSWAKVAEEGYPPIIGFDDQDRYPFGIYFDEENTIQFETKWDSAISTFVKIARAYKFDFKLEYEELGMSLYGAVIYDYKSDELQYKFLTRDEICKIEEEDNDNMYDMMDNLLYYKDYEPYTKSI